MKPIKFKQQNVTYAEKQDEYLDLPAYKAEDGYMVSCWELTLRERIKMLFTGCVWVHMWTFNQPLQPQSVTIDSPFKLYDDCEVKQDEA